MALGRIWGGTLLGFVGLNIVYAGRPPIGCYAVYGLVTVVSICVWNWMVLGEFTAMLRARTLDNRRQRLSRVSRDLVTLRYLYSGQPEQDVELERWRRRARRASTMLIGIPLHIPFAHMLAGAIGGLGR